MRDLLGVYGIVETRAAFYEKRVKRSSTGSRGYIDALIPGLALIEMKSAGKDLEDAEAQALDYIDDLPDTEIPRWVITSDFHRFRLLDLRADTNRVREFDLTDFRENADALAFLAGYGERTFGSKAQEAASIKAARLMASLYESLEESGYEDHEASVFLVRTLFALYADDAGLWDRDLFLEFLETRTAPDGSDLGPQLSLLYQVMGKEVSRRQSNLDELIARFPYVNGGVFEEAVSIPAFDTAMRDRLIRAAMFNWSAISPAIFGSLFQAVKDKRARRELGEHYTTETNIMKVIGPMFLDELRQRFSESHNDTVKLKRLRADMAKMQFLDPACGCGNFLVVGYRQMRALDLEVLVRIQELSGDSSRSMFFTEENLAVRLSSFHGIELEEWPAQIAATALHLVEHQANQAMELALGSAPDPLPLDRIKSIVVGNALRTDWAAVVKPSENVYVMGNPPFLGHKSKKVDQRADLRHVWGSQFDGYLDYVTAWFKKAADYFGSVRGHFAFVSTNSITQGQPVPGLFGPLFDAGWRIGFAHRTFAWTSEAPSAASVHCVVLGFDRSSRGKPTLFEYGTLKGDPIRVPVSHQINPYLLDAANAFVQPRETPLGKLPSPVYGTMPVDGGFLLLDDVQARDEALTDEIASKYVRPFVGAKELLHNSERWCLWLEDASPTEIRSSPFLRRRVEACKDWRAAQTTTGDAYKLRNSPHLFRPNSQRPVSRYVCIPAHVSENYQYLPVAYFDPLTISGNANFTMSDPTGLAFSVISSGAFVAWQRAVGGRIKSDLRFSKTLTWNTFPLPPLTDKHSEAMIGAGRAVLEAREQHAEWSLADHYSPLGMDPRLLRAHRELDAAVDAALGLRARSSDDDRLRVLFSKYAALVSANELALAKTSRPRRKPGA